MKKNAHRKNPVSTPDKTTYRTNLGPLFANVKWDEEVGYYSAWTDGHYFASGGDTPEEAFEMLKEAIRGHLEVAKEHGIKLPFTASEIRRLEKAVAIVDDDERDHRLINAGLKEQTTPWPEVERRLADRRAEEAEDEAVVEDFLERERKGDVEFMSREEFLKSLGRKP